jgi:hypothetical protein
MWVERKPTSVGFRSGSGTTRLFIGTRAISDTVALLVLLQDDTQMSARRDPCHKNTLFFSYGICFKDYLYIPSLPPRPILCYSYSDPIISSMRVFIASITCIDSRVLFEPIKFTFFIAFYFIRACLLCSIFTRTTFSSRAM